MTCQALFDNFSKYFSVSTINHLSQQVSADLCNKKMPEVTSSMIL